MKRLIVPMFCCGMACAGCTTMLKSEHVKAGADAPGEGVLYNLPRAAFDVDVKFLVTDCQQDSNKVFQFSYDISSGTIRHYLVPDPVETYRVPYSELNAATKLTSASVTLHPSGMIKSINSKVEDKTSQVMASVSGTVINLFKTYTVGVAPTALIAEKACDPVIATALAERETMQAALVQAKAKDAELVADQKKAEEISLKLAATNAELAAATEAKDQPKIARLKSEVAKLQRQLDYQIKMIGDRSPQAPASQAALEKIEGQLTATGTLIGWSPDPPDPRALCANVNADAEKFLGVLAKHREKTLGQHLPIAPFTSQVCVQLLDKQRAALKPAEEASAGQTGSYPGIVYRLPATGSVYVWREETGQYASRASSVSLPQFGAKGLIWLKNAPFDKNSIVANFNEDGSLSNLTFEAEARAERAAAAMQETSKSLVDLMQLRADAIKAKAAAEDAEEAKEHQDQITSIDRQIALIGKNRELAAAQQPPKDALDLERDQLAKQVEIEKLRKQLRDLGSGDAAP